MNRAMGGTEEHHLNLKVLWNQTSLETLLQTVGLGFT